VVDLVEVVLRGVERWYASESCTDERVELEFFERAVAVQAADLCLDSFSGHSGVSMASFSAYAVTLLPIFWQCKKVGRRPNWTFEISETRAWLAWLMCSSNDSPLNTRVYNYMIWIG
jgi:hypothetical protein